jgi:hypothetical protein
MRGGWLLAIHGNHTIPQPTEYKIQTEHSRFS